MNQLVQIAESIGDVYKALSVKDRRQNAHHRNIRLYEPRMASATGEFFRLLKAEVDRGTRHMPRGKPAQIADKLADWRYIREEGRKIYNKPLTDISLISADHIAASRITKQERTDPIGEEATAWAGDHSATLVTGITTETMMAIREIVRDGVARGLALQQIAPNIRNLVGLNYRQALAAGNLLTRLTARGLAESEITKKITRYVNKAHRYRAIMIARTETAFSLNSGTLIAYKSMGIKKVIWVADAKACAICAANNGVTFTVQEAWGLIPEHPNCECCWIMAT